MHRREIGNALETCPMSSQISAKVVGLNYFQGQNPLGCVLSAEVEQSRPPTLALSTRKVMTRWMSGHDIKPAFMLVSVFELTLLFGLSMSTTGVQNNMAQDFFYMTYRPLHRQLMRCCSGLYWCRAFDDWRLLMKPLLHGPTVRYLLNVACIFYLTSSNGLLDSLPPDRHRFNHLSSDSNRDI